MLREKYPGGIPKFYQQPLFWLLLFEKPGKAFEGVRLAGICFISLQGLLQHAAGHAACHAFHVGDELWIRSCALNEEGNRTALGAESCELGDTSDGSPTEVGIHLEVQRVTLTDGACAGQHAKRWDGEIDILRARAVGRDVHVGAEVLFVVV